MKKILFLSIVASTLLFAEAQNNLVSKPSVTLVGDFSYVKRSQEVHETNIDGFTHAAHEGEHEHSGANSNEGFNFNKAEVEVSVPIDEYIKVQSTFHLSEDSFEVEELYGTTQNRDGFNFKAGKFLSSFGENNSKHSETWDFGNQPLINNALFGTHGINEKGVGVSWNNKNLKIGYELLTGENELSFGNAEIEYGDGNITIEGNNKPELHVVYLKYNNKIGITSIDTGLSYGVGKARLDHTEDETPHALVGDVKLFGANLSIKLPFTRTSNVKFSTEYIQRQIDNGVRYAGDTTIQDVKMNQSGINTSLVYTVNPKWKIGVQYDDIIKNEKIVNDINTNKSEDLKRTSFMVEHALSSHNRLRLQYNNDKSQHHDGEPVSYNEVLLQWMFEFSTGKHNHNH